MKLDIINNDIESLVKKIDDNRLDLQPNFQRGQVWTESKKRRLIDSVLREWYIPPVHIVINDDLDREEILDGQQRLRAIHEFVNDAFQIEGTLKPQDEQIRELDGLYYSELPRKVRSRFDKFPITTVRLREYRPGEPGELFFRLNQLSSLTAAEQRNALFGPARDQIKILSNLLEERADEYSIGFTNSRMNYDDVLSRLAVCIENGGIDEKVTAQSLELRYRSGAEFSDRIFSSISTAIKRFTRAVEASDIQIKFNKATVFSWLYFIIDNRWPNEPPYVEDFAYFLAGFEVSRSNAKVLSDLHSPAKSLAAKFSNEAYILTRIFSDKATSRVNDVSSVVMRDVCLNATMMWYGPSSFLSVERFRRKEKALEHLRSISLYLPDHNRDRLLEDQAYRLNWGRL